MHDTNSEAPEPIKSNRLLSAIVAFPDVFTGPELWALME